MDRPIEQLRRRQTGNHQQVAPTNQPEPPFPEIDQDAFHGVLGEICNEIRHESEADPVGVLVQLLVFVGNAFGTNPHCLVERDRHGSNLFAVLVGESSKGRKGTSLGIVRTTIGQADPEWSQERWQSGLSSGEGLVFPIRDATYDGDEIVDPGVTDKRLLVIESEFGKTLRMLKRPENVLSAILREGWDGRPLSFLTKHNAMGCKRPHISLVGHVTKHELSELLSGTDIHNGLGNRIVWVRVRRGKRLPFGGSYNIERFTPELVRIIEFGKKQGRIEFASVEAKDLWAAVYTGELSDDPGGNLGALLARSESQVLRLALIYALADREPAIETQHLKAALALWKHCRASTAWAFNQQGSDRKCKILSALTQAGPSGLSATDFRDLFSKNLDSESIRSDLAELVQAGVARYETHPTGGRRKEVWTICT